VTFYQHLETILATHTPPPGVTRQSQSPWLFLDAAHTIFSLAKRRVYVGKTEGKPNAPGGIPAGLEPVLEELPKWSLLIEVLEEIEKEGYFNPAPDRSYSSTLIMCSDESTCRQLREYLQTMNETPLGDLEGKQDEEIPKSAAYMMRRKLRGYFAWKSDFVKFSSSLYGADQKALSHSSAGNQRSSGDSYRGRVPPNKRRRVRGGSAAATGPTRGNAGAVQVTEEQSAQVVTLLAGIQPTEEEQSLKPDIVADPFEDSEDYYELYEMNNLVVIHPYDGDMDERLLDELRPRYVIMYEPDPAFIRRIEVMCIPACTPP
jgi:DNA excision repair protein ERCC-4